MGIVNPADILLIRQKAEEFLLSTAYVLRYQGVTSVRGQISVDYAEPEEISCRVINRSGDVTSSVAAQFRAIQQSTTRQLYRMQIPYALTITTKDKILYQDREFTVKYVPLKHEMMGAQIIFIEETD